MYGTYGQGFMNGFDMSFPFLFGTTLSLVLLWSLFWKGLALWHSAGRKDAWWFVALLLINTMGLLEIIYLFAFAKLKINELFGKKRSS